jgi:DNA repair exonuclease SbcCD ATPase subunit
MKVIKKIPISVKHIAHIADVHIRKVTRHDEYEEVFLKLYKELKDLTENYKDVIIYLGGDIVHSKLDMSPELFSVTYKFLKNCADIAPTLLILGNHDCNLNNKSRLDALTPIVESLNHPNLFFLKDTGIYRTNNVDFVVWSILDDTKNYVVPAKNKNKQILFYHGVVDSATTDQGMQIRNNKLKVENISDFDYVMLGDIHKYQYLNENKTIAYCGSTIQQSFGESLYHGFLFWNIDTGFSKFIQVNNDYGFYTLHVKNGKWQKASMPDTFCKNANIRIIAHDTNATDMAKLTSALKTSTNVNDIKVQKITTKPETFTVKNKKLGDIRDIEYQNQLILSYLEQSYNMDSNLKNDICLINRELNTNIDVSKTLKNVTWIPKKFEFSNMFSYGEANEINFDNMQGIYGLFANNAAGKSSILDALMFCLFDKCSRTFKASQILNNKKDSFSCKFHFEIHGKEYFIEKVGIKDKKDHVKVDVNFYTYENENKILLNGEDRESTNSIIRDYLGNYDEFILTTLSLQNNNSNFVDKPQRERKDLLSQFLDLNVFEELTQQSNSELNQIKAVIKEFSKQDYPNKIAIASNDKKNVNEMLKVAKEEKTDITNKINDLTDEIVGLSKSIKSIDEELIDLNLDELEKNKNEIQIKIQKSKDKIFELENRNIELGNQYNAIESEYVHIDIEKLEQNAIKEQDHADYNNLYTNKLERLLIELNNVQEKVDKLHKHEYDPECKYCIENEFVKDALIAKQTINQLYKEKDDIESLIKHNLIQSEPYNNSIMLLAEYNSNKSSALKVRADILDIESKIKEFSIFEINATNKINEIESKIKNYNANKESIDFNKKISIEIQKLQDEKNTLSFKLLQLDESISNFTAQIKISDTVLKDAKEKIQRLNSLEQKFKAYELYTKATNRNGVPYNLISDILPQIESQANDILSYLVDFKIVLDTDGKSINIYITYDDDRTWALELASGMEKFISGIAIRNALLNYSNLPRPNFIAIDEGFGVLDSENMSALYNIFQYLKTQYKFILIISHIDALKDMAENQIEIYKDGGFSKVFF